MPFLEVPLNDLAKRQPQLFSSHARRIDAWPVLFNLRPECVPWCQNLVKMLGVGLDRPLKSNQKVRSRMDDYLTQTAIRLIEHVLTEVWFFKGLNKKIPVDQSTLSTWAVTGQALPKFSKSTFSLWWPVLRDAFNEGLPEPEKDAKLMAYVGPEYRESSASRIRDLLKRKALSLVT